MYVCGVDAGATKTDCAISSSDGFLIGRWFGGPALMLAGDEFAAVIAGAVDQCCAGAGLPASAIQVLAVGLAGVDTADRRDQATAVLSAAFNGSAVIVENDASVALEAATATRPAAVVMAGTGSIGYGEDADGRPLRVGGWGHVLGDEGSGHAIGVAACAAVLKTFDGRAADTLLTNEVREHFSLEDVRELLGLSERFVLEPSAAASFAPTVIRLAQDGDGTAKQIVECAANHLVGHARRLIGALGLERQGLLMLGGGLLANSEYYTELVLAGIKAERPGVTIGSFDLPPVGGAVLKALGRLPERNQGDLRARLMRGFGAPQADQAYA